MSGDSIGDKGRKKGGSDQPPAEEVTSIGDGPTSIQGDAADGSDKKSPGKKGREKITPLNYNSCCGELKKNY